MSFGTARRMATSVARGALAATACVTAGVAEVVSDEDARRLTIAAIVLTVAWWCTCFDKAGLRAGATWIYPAACLLVVATRLIVGPVSTSPWYFACIGAADATYRT